MKKTAYALVIIILTAILIVAHFLLYETVVGFLAINDPAWILTLRILFLALAVLFPLTSITTFRFNNFFTRFFYKISAWWLGTLLYTLVAAFLICLTVIIFGLATGSATLFYVVVGFYGIALLLSLYGAINASWLRVTRVTVPLEKLPAQWKNKQIVFLSDTHFGQVRSMGFAKKLVRVISRLKPEAILFGGDFYDGVMMDFASVANEFGKIKTRLGTYFVTGNHEGYVDFAHAKVKPLDALAHAGIKILTNKSADLDGIMLHGVDFATAEKKEDFEKILESFRASEGGDFDMTKPNILMKHTPFFVDEAAHASMSLELCGHTHRGQQFPFMYITRKMFKGHDYGLTRRDKLQIYTSSGAGTWGPSLRIGTKAELVLITFV